MKNRRRRSKRNLWWGTLVVLVALYAVGGFFVAPRIARTQLTQRLAGVLQREVTIEKVRVNPFSCSATVESLRIIDHDGADLAGWQSAHINFDPLMSLLHWRWQFGEVHLVGPHQRLNVDRNGALNVGDLLRPAADDGDGATDQEPAGIPAVGVTELLIEEWTLSFSDESRQRPFHTVAGPMTFKVADFSTKKEAASQYSFTGTTDSGESFSWSGTLSIQPLGSSGQIQLSGFSIPKHMPLAETLIGGRVESGRLTLRTDYDVVLTGQPSVRLSNASVVIEDFRLNGGESGSGSVLLGRIDVAVPEADAVARTAEVSRIALNGLVVQGTRRPDGTISLLDLWPTGEHPGDDHDEPPSGPAPSIAVAAIAITNSQFSLTDESNARATTITLDDIQATITNTGTDLDREIGVEANLLINGKGTLGINGVVRARPLAARLDVRTRDVPLRPFDVYVSPPADVRINRGSLDFTGRLEVAQAEGSTSEMRWTGDIAVRDFAVNDAAGRYQLVGWQQLAFKDSIIALNPLELVVAEIALDAPTLHATITPDGRFTLLEALGQTHDAPPTATAVDATAGSAVFTAQVDTVVISDGQVTLHDRSTRPEFISTLRDFSGTIRGLSSETPARANVDLSGVLDRSGQLAVTGTINPLAQDLFSDIEVHFHDIALSPFTPYSGRYLGRTIKSGTLDLDLKYRVSENVLEGDNRILLDQFFLGDPVATDQSLGLPIGLALAVLRDRTGVIKLPPTKVEGSLDDPDFRIGPLVMHALTNVFVKAATAPFAMLGGKFGAREDQDLSYADFEPGSSELSPEAADKLSILATALYESPALHLAIHSPPRPELDREALRERKFRELLREEKHLLLRAWSATRQDEATAPAAIDQVRVTAEEENDIIRYAFVRRFPERATEVDLAPGDDATTRPSEESEPPEGERNVVQRILRSVFGSSDREPNPPRESSPAAQADDEDGEVPAAATSPSLTVAEMRTALDATIEVPDLEFQALARARAQTVHDRVLVAGTLEPERVAIAQPATIPEGAEDPAGAARVFFALE